MSTGPSIQSVSGGSHGVTAGYEQMLALADKYDTHAADFVEMAGLGARVMANGDLLESAILSPASFADAEAQVLEATTGANGLTVRALGIEADAMGVRAVVAAFEASDSLGRHAMEMLDNTLGNVIGVSLRAALPALLVAGGISYAYYQTLSPQEQQALVAELTTDLGQLLHDHPEMAQHLINSGGGLLEGLGLPIGMLDPGDGPLDGATTNDAARLLALWLGNDTEAEVTRLEGVDGSLNQTHAPDELADLMKSLNDTNKLDITNPDHHGAIQIQHIVGPDGQERYIVYVPGTDDLSPVPKDGAHARDMETNYQLIGGMDSAYGNGITEAMREAGLSGKDVVLVGHSQGGMVATSLAADPDFAREFNVKHVVTAGAPTAQVTDLPAGTHAIHFENRGDAVPMLDGEDNPDEPNRTTVRFDEGSSDTADNHAIDHYVHGAAAADQSSNGSIQDQIKMMEEDGFLGSGTVAGLDTYQITRR